MQKQITDPRHSRILVKTVFIFLASYLVFLFLWIQVKDTYGYAITLAASKLVSGLKNARLEEITQEKDIIQATFSPFNGRTNMLVDITVKTSSYSFNAPLTFAIMMSLSLFILRKKRAYAEAFLIILFIHFLYVFSLEAKELTEVFMEKKIEAISMPRLFVYQFIWGFTDNMVIRFEPFLIGFYMFVRFRKQ
jgi:hypothetical protein